MMSNPLQDRTTLVLDGGLATELEAQGHNITNKLWSASILLSNPQAIKDAHRAFLDAGAECIITASYQASRPGLVERGLTEAEADNVTILSVRLAIETVNEYLADHPGMSRPLVAASLGPYGAAAQHDGSEYTGVYHADREHIKTFQKDRLELLDGSGADLIAIETIPNRTEVEILDELLRHTSTPAWISFCCQDAENLSDGTPLAEATAIFSSHPGVFALGVNCVSPELVVHHIGIIKSAAPDKAIVVYPNSGETFRSSDNTWHGTATPDECAVAATKWKKAGATIIGGCCRMGPEHIREIGKSLQDL